MHILLSVVRILFCSHFAAFDTQLNHIMKVTFAFLNCDSRWTDAACSVVA